ncbi:MAG: GNAT family N-acetyltransferase [Deltaproteobacteria bacterium]|nr:GNAT family N-acetyltransferase [Deltaproteobacteria bacterium]
MAPATEQGSQVIVRKITEDDIEDVLAIDRGITGNDRALTYTSAPNSYVGGELGVSVVAEVDGKVVGFLLGQITDSPFGRSDTAMLILMGVDPGYRRRKIGSRLVKAFEGCCRQKGVTSVHVMVSWQDWWLLSFIKSMEFSLGEIAEFVKAVE